MQVANVLNVKGADVDSIEQSRTVADAIALLKERRIGALIVTGDIPPLVGIFSERDVVRAIGTHGAIALTMPVAHFMSAEVVSCDRTTTMEQLMDLMTNHRIRHVPVVEDGVLHGLVSIGDVVKARLGELENEKRDLLDYVGQG